jgi:hypothetical protein
MTEREAPGAGDVLTWQACIKQKCRIARDEDVDVKKAGKRQSDSSNGGPGLVSGNDKKVALTDKRRLNNSNKPVKTIGRARGQY